MSQFKKYLLHFSLVLFLIFIVMTILCFLDSEEIQWWLPIIIFLCVWVIYAIQMAHIFSKKSNIETFELNVNDEYVLNEIDKIAFNKAKRTKKQLIDDKIIYSMKNKYSSWLTNPIIVKCYDDKILMSVPTEFVKLFKILNKT